MITVNFQVAATTFQYPKRIFTSALQWLKPGFPRDFLEDWIESQHEKWEEIYFSQAVT